MSHSPIPDHYLKNIDADYERALSLLSDGGMTDAQLQLYVEVEKRIMRAAKRFWEEGFVQEAYSFVENRVALFEEKIAWASALMEARPLLALNFFDDVFFLKDMDPVELILYFTHEQILRTFVTDCWTTPHSVPPNNSKWIAFNDFLRLLVAKKWVSNRMPVQISAQMAIPISDEAELNCLLSIQEESEKAELISILYQLSQELNIESIEQPLPFNFKKDGVTRLKRYFDQHDLEKAILFLARNNQLSLSSEKSLLVEPGFDERQLVVIKDEFVEQVARSVQQEQVQPFSEEEFVEQAAEIIQQEQVQPSNNEETLVALDEEDDFSRTDEDVDRATEITEMIFILALEKGINYLTEPIPINFELDEVEDLVANYSVDLLKSALEEMNSFSFVVKKKTTSLINTMDSVRKYLNGKTEETETIHWQNYAPASVRKEIKGLSLEDAYAIVLKKSKERTITGTAKDEIMDYRFDLEQLIFGDQEQLFENPYVFDEFMEYPFEEYVRHTVEAIILPHVEVLQKIEAQNGKIQFVDVWSQHFSDQLKQKVRTRDGFKCVICDEESNLHVHHKIPRKYGGVNHPDNLVTLCSSCHGAVETADFEHAYQKCMLNAIKAKTSFQKPVHIMKDLHLLKEEILVELDRVFIKASKRDELLGQEILQILKKVEVVFES